METTGSTTTETAIAVYLSNSILVIAILLFLVLVLKTNILKDQSVCKTNKPFSLAKVQLAIWSLTIFCCFTHILGTLNFDIGGESKLAIGSTALILLGISGGATILGKTIDDSDISKTADDGSTIERMQDKPSKGFIKDILSDKNGISLHRTQQVMFTVALVVAYIVSSIGADTLPEWDTSIPMLMGISSAGYLGIKMNENG